MAAKFVRSGAAGAGTGADWANAYTTLAAGFAGSAAGGTLWVADDHAETQASAMTLTSPGTINNWCLVYCVDHTVASPGAADLKLTATVTTTGANNITQNGHAYFYGITFSCGTGSSAAILAAAQTGDVIFDNCALKIAVTDSTTNTSIKFAANGIWTADLRNTTLNFGAAGQSLESCGPLKWKNTTAAALAGTTPTNLFQESTGFSSGLFGPLELEGLDLSAMGSGKTIVTFFQKGNGRATLKDCKLGASVTVAAVSNMTRGQRVSAIRCDSGATNYRNELYLAQGTETTETSITRVGGASDGLTAQARKLATTANVTWLYPFEAIPITVYVDVAGVAYTATLEGTWHVASLPKNDEIWVDAEYLGASGNPQGSFATGTKANNLATGTNLTASTETWNGGGSGAGWSPFQLSVTFTPQQAGWVTLYVKAAKASSTFYVDPRLTGLNVTKTYVAGSPSPIIVNERDLADTSLDCIEMGIAA